MVAGAWAAGKLIAAGGYTGSAESAQTETLDVGSGPPPPPPPPPHYVVTTQTGQSIVPGTVDIGNHCDDCTTFVALPFPVHIYGRSYTTVTVESNGTLQFTTDVPEFSAGQRIGGGTFDTTRAFVERAVSFPTNIEIEATHTFVNRPGGATGGARRA